MEIWEKIGDRAAAYRDSTAKNLCEMVKIPSMCGDEKMLIARVSELLDAAGFQDIRTDGLGNLIGRVGKGDRILAIDAHIDTVDTGDRGQWNFEPFCGEIEDGWVLGRGTADQKGGAASMITAGRILEELSYDGNFSIYFTFTIMEEDCEGLCWNYLIEREKIVPDLALITEPTNLGIYRGQRGRVEIELFFQGISSHGSAPERGENAIYKASDAVAGIQQLNERLSADDFLGKGTVAVTHISSESPSLCAVPDKCMIHLDRRLTWGETRNSAIREVADAAGAETSLEIPVYDIKSYRETLFPQEKYFPTWKIDQDHPLVKAGVETYSLLFGGVPSVGKWTFSTNGVAICGKHGIPTIGFGPGNEIYAHAPNEKIPIDDLQKASSFYALLPYVLEEDELMHGDEKATG